MEKVSLRIDVNERSADADGSLIEWTWPGGGFERFVPRRVLAELEHLASRTREAMWKQLSFSPLIQDLGVRLGHAFVGENSGLLLDGLASRQGGFALCAIAADSERLSPLPWELLVLPRGDIPLLFDARVRGSLEMVRHHRPSTHPKTTELGHKVLAASAHTSGRELSVEQEMANLRRRFATRPAFRLREVANADYTELATRLKFQCSLFLFAGHGRYEDGVYTIQLRSGSLDVSALGRALHASHAKVLVFDSCESGCGSALGGAGRLLTESEATCLLGMWGPADDNISTWHMPSVVESLLLGAPVWSCVNELRLLLFAHRSDVWFQPVVSIKPDYVPFDPLRERRSYLERLTQRRTRL